MQRTLALRGVGSSTVITHPPVGRCRGRGAQAQQRRAACAGLGDLGLHEVAEAAAFDLDQARLRDQPPVTTSDRCAPLTVLIASWISAA